MHLAYIWIVSHLSAKNYRNWWKFDEVLTKTNLLSFFWDTVYIVSLWQYIVRSGKLKRTDHKFPDSGHSYLDSDRKFSHIEQKVGAVSNVYDVDQYHNLMAQSQQKSKPHITRMQGRLYDMKALPAALMLTNYKRPWAGMNPHAAPPHNSTTVNRGDFDTRG